MRLICGEALATLQTLPDASVDCIVADPPYGTTRCAWDSVIPLGPLWRHLRRVVKPAAPVVLFAAQPFASALVMSNPLGFRYDLVWDKKNPSGHLNAKRRPLRRHEDVLVFCDGEPPYDPQMRAGARRRKGSQNLDSDCYGEQAGSVTFGGAYYPTSILEFSNADRAGKLHPSQKPDPLLDWLVRTYAAPGQTVLDFCMGVGTTGIAALKYGCDFVGIEQNPGYFAVAQRRINEAEACRDGRGVGELFAHAAGRDES